MFKKLKFTVAILAICFSINAGSSQEKITLSSQRNDDNSITYSYEKNKPGSHVLYLDIQQISNAIPPSEFISITGYRGTLFTLKPINDKSPVNFRFSYTPLRGKLRPKPKFDFVYCLPFKNGKEIKIDEITSISESAGVQNKNPLKMFQFTTSSRVDSVFVARKGQVVEVVERHNRDYNLEYIYKQEANYVVIEHKDGTFARYDVLEKNTVVPEEGDVVFPGDFLAMAGTYDKAENKQVRFRVFYLSDLKEENFKGSRKVSDGITFHTYLNPIFMTTEGPMRLKKGDFAVSKITEKQIIEEMTKREKKKRAK